MIDEYKSADIFLLPSIWEEPAPMVVAEAFASGLPIVAFDTGGLSERITDGYNGMIIEKNNIGKFSEAIDLLLQRNDKLERFSKNAVLSAKNEFSIDSLVRRHLLAYEV